jgi:GH3 auxin-responsive promoter
MIFKIFLNHLVTIIFAFPRWIQFVMGIWRCKQVQLRLLTRILQANASTTIGKQYQFTKITTYKKYLELPVLEYCDYENYIASIHKGEENVLTTSKVTRFLPTSGTSSQSKHIPFTYSLREEYASALNVWLVNLFIRRPSIVFGKHYWSMSPSTKQKNPDEGAVPIGFSDDTSYFSRFQARIIAKNFAVPPLIQSVEDPQTHEYLTLLFLLREEHLSFIFIWSPTFIIAKLQNIKQWKERLIQDIRNGTINSDCTLSQPCRNLFAKMLLPNSRRADYLESINFSDRLSWKNIWPDLKMISCWADGSSGQFRSELGSIFPNVVIEEKGLIATEAVVTIPWYRGNNKPIAYRSHFFEFQEIGTGNIMPLWMITPGNKYTVLVTTSGGLYRYQMHDIVEVTGYIGKVPCLRFLGRENAVVDIVGEKISECAIQLFLSEKLKQITRFSFALVAPTRLNGNIAYTLFFEPLDTSSCSFSTFARELDNELKKNYHYCHARNIKQLHSPRVFVIEQGTGLLSYIAYETSLGKKAGDIKIQMLDSKFSWDQIFRGSFFLN